MMADHQQHYLIYIRQALATVLSPLQYAVSLPITSVQWLANNARSHQTLLLEKEHLRLENLLLRTKFQKFNDLQSENARLRLLLNSAPKQSDKMLVADVMAVEFNPYTRKIMINKGLKDGVFEGQPLLDANGVLGQVEHVNYTSSTVMLVTDPSHELPVQIVRNKIPTIAVGMGTVNRLALLYLPNNSGVQIGDKLVTSGLGGQFPAGYPVGTIIEVKPDIGNPYALVQAEPFTLLEHNREVLLVWQGRGINEKAPLDSPSGSDVPTVAAPTTDKTQSPPDP